LTDQYDAGILF